MRLASTKEHPVDPWWTYCPNCGGPTQPPPPSVPQRVLFSLFHWFIPDLEAGMVHVRHCEHCGSFEVIPPPYPGLRCQRCGYDLTGSIADACPECGWHLPKNLKRCRDDANITQHL